MRMPLYSIVFIVFLIFDYRFIQVYLMTFVVVRVPSV